MLFRDPPRPETYALLLDGKEKVVDLLQELLLEALLLLLHLAAGRGDLAGEVVDGVLQPGGEKQLSHPPNKGSKRGSDPPLS